MAARGSSGEGPRQLWFAQRTAMVNITVDGITLDAPAGAPLLEVLKNNGFYVPGLCYIDGLKPYAGCRTCLVDIEGPPGLQLSCTAVVQENMVVTTNSDEVKEARKSRSEEHTSELQSREN